MFPVEPIQMGNCPRCGGTDTAGLFDDKWVCLCGHTWKADPLPKEPPKRIRQKARKRKSRGNRGPKKH